MNDGLFYFASTGLVIASLSVAFSTYPVRAVLALIGAFISAALLWLDLGAEFLALALIFVYVGAVMALFLFIVFMLNIDRMKNEGMGMLRVGLIVGIILAMGILLMKGYGKVVPNTLKEVATESNTELIGQRLYQHYWVLFEYIAFVLLTAMIVAISLVDRKNKVAKYQDIASQVAMKPKDSIHWMSS